jgi:hypothetical protein
VAVVKEPAVPNHERGQTIVLLALMIIVLIAFVGLGTDVTLIYTAKAHLQRAVDAAALAAANKLPDQVEADGAAYEFTRLHGYTFSPSGDPLQITFPIEDPPRKLAVVTGTVDVDLAFLRVIGWRQTPVTASAAGESAPLDVYLVLDLSESMVYDTPKPVCWPSCCPAACPMCGAANSWQECQAYYCNRQRNCDPLDVHIKDSAEFFVDQLDPRYDRVGVIRYDRWGWYPPDQSMALTNNFNAVKKAIRKLDAFEPYSVLCTNIGDGLLVANHYLSLPPPPADSGGRTDSIWAIVLLTDGRANIYRSCTGCPDDCGDPSCQIQECQQPCRPPEDWARANAWSSWNNHKIVVYTVAYGQAFFDYPQYRQLMIDIADITDNGVVDGQTDNFWAVPNEAGLRQALAEIAEHIYTRLVR